MTNDINNSFLEMIEGVLPDSSEKEQFEQACTRPLKKSITINTDKISVDDFIGLTKPWGRHLTPHPFTDEPITFYIDRDNTEIALGNTFLYKSGFFYIQEVAASMPALLIDSKPGDVILDVCAAPGGKTSQLANRLLSFKENPGLVIANDVAGPRIKTLAHNINLQGCYNTAITKFNGFMFGKHLPNFFDHILVDAPCSGEGTGFKSDYALKFWRQEEINKIAGTQFQILVSAIKATKVGGTIVYSTCTLNPYENEGILARILEFFKGSVELESVPFKNAENGYVGKVGDETFDQGGAVKRFWPHRQKTGGFFVSKLRKIADHNEKPVPKDHKLLPKNNFKITMHKKLQLDVAKYAKQQFGITIDTSRYFFIATKDNVYVTGPQFAHVQPHLHCEKVGVPVFKTDRIHQFRPTHYFGLIFGHLAIKNTITFNDNQMQDYTYGGNIATDYTKDDTETPYKVIQRGIKKRGMGVTKLVNGEWKNKWGK